MRKATVLSLTLVSCALATPVGCGSLDGHTDKQTPLATITGAISVPNGTAVSSDLRVAIIWLSTDANGKVPLMVGTDVPVASGFPASFTLELDAAPPAGALVTASVAGSVPQASGMIVAYEDLNGDNELDLVSPTASAFVDKIVGVNTDDYIGYSEGAANGVPSGYGFWTPAGTTTLPITTPITLSLTATTADQQDMCAPPMGGDAAPLWVTGDGGWSGSTTTETFWNVASQGTPPNGFPQASDPSLICNGSTSYAYATCTQNNAVVCNPPQDCAMLNVTLGSISPPAGWPCQ